MTENRYHRLHRLTRTVQRGFTSGVDTPIPGISGTAVVRVAEKLATFSYDLVHQFDKIRRYTSQNGDAGGNQGFATSQYVFDKNGRLDTLTHTKVAGNATIAAYDWNYDRVSRVSAMDFLVSAQNHEDVLSYAYNPRHELTNVTRPTQTPSNNESYAFDKNGNRTSSTTFNGTASYQLISGNNNDNRIFRDGQFQYSYDAEGNIIQRTQLNGGLANGPTRNFTWDHRNRLVKVELRPSPGATVTQSVEYRYDAFNQLIGRIHDPDGPGAAPPQQTWYIHDEGQIVLEGTGTANTSVTHRYLWGPAVDQILADEKITTTGSTVDWALGDNLGTVRDWINSSGTAIEHLAYDAFGNITFDSAATIDHLFAYTGRLFDKATGLQNNLHRWYDPHQGRWMNQDPIGFAAGDPNLYRYVGNEPIGWVDPEGLKPGDEGGDEKTKNLQDQQERLDHLQRGLQNLIATLKHHPDVKGLSRKDVDSLLDHMNYATRYNKIGVHITLRDGNSFNPPFTRGFYFDADAFWGDEYTALQVLIHEPMHDLTRFGIGHGRINPIVGPYSSENHFQKLYDYLKGARLDDGTSLWNMLTKNKPLPIIK